MLRLIQRISLTGSRYFPLPLQGLPNSLRLGSCLTQTQIQSQRDEQLTQNPYWDLQAHKVFPAHFYRFNPSAAAFTYPLALEHLQDFIYYAYIFYTGLLESGWLDALGDLAWYRMAVAEQPGTGKLHHHLGLLSSREVEGIEL